MPTLAVQLWNQLALSQPGGVGGTHFPCHNPVVSCLLSTSGGAVDLDEPDLQLLVHHEVEAKQLEAVIREVSCADGGLHAREAAPAGTGEKGPGRWAGNGTSRVLTNWLDQITNR